MPRSNDNAGAVSADRIQPGRIMLSAWDGNVDDELVYRITSQYGEVKSVHRPPTNRQLIFVQYEDPSSAAVAIPNLRRLAIFRNVDCAIKSDRFTNDKSGGAGEGSANNSINNDEQQPKNMKYQHHNKGGANQQQKQQRNVNPNEQRNGRIDNMSAGPSPSSMEYGSPKMQLQTDSSPPKFSLECLSCNKRPNFECRCGAFYCGLECQRTDWPKHKDICMPRLVQISYASYRIIQLAAASKQVNESPNDSFPSADRRSQSNGKNNRNQPNQTNQQKGGNKAVPRPQTQQQENRKTSPQNPPKSSPVAEKVSGVTNKLQRLKLAKSIVGSASESGSAVKGVLLPGVFPREGSTVKITASLPSGVLYIYHNNGKEGGQHSDYYTLTNRMFQAVANAKPLTAVPSVGDVIFAPFMDGFYRAKVVSVDGENLEVFFVDFGNSDKVQWRQSREIANGELKWAKFLTYPVSVEGIDSFSPGMIKLLETLEHVEDFELVKAEPTKGAISVVLKRPKQAQTLNMELIELMERELRLKEEERAQQIQREAKLEQEKKQQQKKQGVRNEIKVADPSNYQPVLFDESMDTRQLSEGGPRSLLIVDASEVLETQLVSVVAFEELETYASVMQHCSQAGLADSNVYKPTKEGEVCLVLYQDDWSRALYDISEGNFMLLDVGLIVDVPAENVRRFPPGLSHVVFNNEVLVENLAKLKGMMKDGKPDSVNGMPIDAKITASDIGFTISIVDSKSV